MMEESSPKKHMNHIKKTISTGLSMLKKTNKKNQNKTNLFEQARPKSKSQKQTRSDMIFDFVHLCSPRQVC